MNVTPPTADPAAPTPRRSSAAVWAMAAVMIGLAGLFLSLGLWQLARLEQKETLIAAVARNADLPAAVFPAVAEWPDLDWAGWRYRPAKLIGRFADSQPVLVFTNLPNPNGTYGGPGYWVVAPFNLDSGGVVLVNRGFVPIDLTDRFAPAPDTAQILTGTIVASERTGPFTPPAEPENRLAYVRNTDMLAVMFGPQPGPIAPVLVELSGGPSGALPQGGETEIRFANRHLEYALTWFGLAATVLVMLGFWLWRRSGAGKRG